jgi:hypothetical protein
MTSYFFQKIILSTENNWKKSSTGSEMQDSKVNLAKCKIDIPNVIYLGYRLYPKGFLSGVDTLNAVRDIKPSSSVQEIRQFMDLLVTCEEYCGHQCSSEHTNTQRGKLEGGEISENFTEAFNSLKNYLISEPIVDNTRKHRTYSLIMDASTCASEINGSLGAML